MKNHDGFAGGGVGERAVKGSRTPQTFDLQREYARPGVVGEVFDPVRNRKVDVGSRIDDA